MSKLANLLADARTAIETLEFADGREDANQHAASSAEWLEQIAGQIREQLKTAEVPA